MSDRTITFYRSAISEAGKLYKSPLMSVAIPASVPEAQAIEAAKKHFCAWAKIKDWLELAEFFEVT